MAKIEINESSDRGRSPMTEEGEGGIRKYAGEQNMRVRR